MNCELCHSDVNSLVFKDGRAWCWSCHNQAKGSSNLSTAIATDSIPGGYWIKHGLCNEDGSPKRYDSKSEIKAEAYRRGLFIIGDTPKVNSRLKEEAHAKREAKDHS